jgi:hypothetical protein
MDAVEQWLRDHGHTTAADDWLDDPGMVTVQYEPDNPLHDFLDKIDGPAMIGLDPVIYPACTRCSQAWKLTRSRGVWSWSPDCAHKTATCKLVKA